MNEFDLLKQPIGPGVQTLIEAGAGTGKTYNIENLYLRLLLEGPEAAADWNELGVRQILVVTFTEAATAELVERIRSNLSAAVEMMDAGMVDETRFPGSVIAAWLGRYGTEQQRRFHELARQRLKSALLAFDEAAIMTIHGFCSRMLNEFTFESGIPFDTELIENQGELLCGVIDDWWRRTVYPSRELASFTAAAGIEPSVLQYLAARACASPDIGIVSGGEIDSDPARLAEELLHSLDRFWSSKLSDEIAVLPFKTAPAGEMPGHLESLRRWFEKGEVSAGMLAAVSFCRENTFVGHLHAVKMKKITLSDELRRFLAGCTAFEEGRLRLIASLKKNLLEYLRGERALERRKQEMQVQSFDDLLLSMRRTLRGQAGERFAAAIRRRFRIALIDEFQDTDPVQYDIFTRIFADPATMMLMVGDPKQSIYAFRGADIFAYLDVTGRLREEQRPTLIRNFRSSPELLRAINVLFANSLPFADPQIRYNPAESGAPSGKLLIDDVDVAVAPLQLWRVDGEKKLGRGKAEKILTAATASRIAGILGLSREGRACLRTDRGEVAVAASDIAVLTNNHRQAAAMRRELVVRGVNAVIQKSASVFAAPEATELFHILDAIVNPGDLKALRTALLTSLFAQPAGLIAASREESADDSIWEKWLECFGEYRQYWEKDGFIRMFRSVLDTETGASATVRINILRQPDGERKLTNVLHLAEVLHNISRNGMMGMAAVLEWLRRQLQDPEESSEYEQRLESDDDAVKIMTVFKSKGLQFPIVFCPFTWERGFKGSKKPGVKLEDFIFHAPDAAGQWQPQLYLGDDPPVPVRLNYYREQLSELVRLFYVAVTRAKYLCVIADGNISDADDSALRYLMTEGYADNLNAYLLDPAAEELYSVPVEWEEAGIEVLSPPSQDVFLPPPVAASELTLMPWPENVAVPRHSGVMSFSSLTEGAHSAQAHDPDRDDLAEAVAIPAEMADVREELPLIAGFPRGAVSGDCVHQIFELLDFSLFRRPDWHSRPEVLTLLEHKLRRFGYIPVADGSSEYEEIYRLRMGQLLEMFGNVMTTPLGVGEKDFRLCILNPDDYLAEMDFFFKVARDIDKNAVNQTMRQLGLLDYRNDFDAIVNSAELGFKSGNGPRRGFMTGKIDLLFRHDGKYYLLDWKTTCLGDRYLDYRPQAMLRNMFDASYVLQYYIYTLAVDKYLRHRMRDYDYETHFGGVFYLYVRGINGRDPGSGIFFDRPAASLLKQLYRIFPEE